MRKIIVSLIPFTLLIACTSSGDFHPPPLATSPEIAVKVRIQKVVSGDDITFTINDKKIYGFGKTLDYEFETDAGTYMFGYMKGFKKCDDEVELRAGESYVFNLEPGCSIQMQ